MIENLPVSVIRSNISLLAIEMPLNANGRPSPLNGCHEIFDSPVILFFQAHRRIEQSKTRLLVLSLSLTARVANAPDCMWLVYIVSMSMSQSTSTLYNIKCGSSSRNSLAFNIPPPVSRSMSVSSEMNTSAPKSWLLMKSFIISEKWWTLITRRSQPARTSFWATFSSIVFPLNSTKAFGLSLVSGASRVPSPAANIIAIIRFVDFRFLIC